jgi:hypothetical protein
MRIPRKLKKKIPEGMYCYKGIRMDMKTGIYHIKSCPMFKYIQAKNKPIDKQDEIDREYPEEWIGWCKLLQCEIDDQCKSCGINKY